MQQHDSNYFARRHTPPDPWDGVNRSKFNFFRMQLTLCIDALLRYLCGPLLGHVDKVENKVAMRSFRSSLPIKIFENFVDFIFLQNLYLCYLLEVSSENIFC